MEEFRFAGSCGSHVEIFVHYFVEALHLTATCSVPGYCRVENEKLDPLGDDFVLGRNTWFDSGCMLCFSTPGFWSNFPIFLVDLDSDPEAFLSVLTQSGEVCSVDASGYGPCMRSLHLKLEFLRALKWMTVGMMQGRE